MDLLRNVGSLVISEGAKFRLSKPVLDMRASGSYLNILGY
jgi:hypothetical protein